ncbi:hypothetical protein [Haloarchaeobius sp. HRN-SO-5]|uniref:hypothetical protein n=1 Tax=Haloarchaeobius sp. HRN-SO-5 TaxID=3446118 RepID=UPI003EBE78C5
MTVDRLDDVRSDDRDRWALTAVAVLAGVGLSLVHWSGLLVAGALVALPQRSVARGLAAGVGVGVLVSLVAFLVPLTLTGSVSSVAEMGVVAALPVGIGLALPAFGALVRGLV